NECNVHENYKKRILKAKDIDTIVTGRRQGDATRRLKNRFSRDFAKAEMSVDSSVEDLEKRGVGALRRAAVEGDEINGCFLAGQIAGLVKEEQPAAEIIQETCTQAEALLKGAAKWVK
ncbi:MAG: nitronate monooxygenase, partial [Oscillospiraceae bacterium]|nr:nitronate monooxygenase [Oscillospiraceae bacterium]